jgi:hypothetical protein
MPLDTQTFPITRHWAAAALREVPRNPEIFANKSLSLARKTFLCGSNQRAAIKNWLSRGGLVAVGHGKSELTELGRLVAAQDERADRAWTWWLVHLHLCANEDSFPYSAFFLKNEADGLAWRSADQIVKDSLVPIATDANLGIEETTVSTYFAGVDNAFRPGMPLYDLGLIERQDTDDEKRRLRRTLIKPSDIVTAYATVLFHSSLFPEQTTVEARMLVERGIARALGIKDSQYREALGRITQHTTLGQVIEYRHQLNLDSVQFLKSGEAALRAIRTQAYTTQEVRWP